MLTIGFASLGKLCPYGLRVGAVTLIESFWTVDARCRVGVPHGSARGPLLFYIFNTDLPNRIEDGNFCLRMIPNLSWIAGDVDSLLRS